MRALLSSPRRRRRAARAGIAALVVLAAVSTAWLARDSGRELPPVSTTSRPAEPVQEEQEDEQVPVVFTKELQDEVLPVAAKFVSTAVERKDVAASWELVDPELRAGFTREQWAGGEIPVVPYPVGGARWEVQYSFRGTVGLYVLLTPKEGADVAPTTFLLELKHKRDRWRVSSWVPSAGAAEATASLEAGRASALPLREPGAFDQGNLSPLFLIVPVAGTVGLAFALLAFFLARNSIRSRRAMRAYGSRGRLPELPRKPS